MAATKFAIYSEAIRLIGDARLDTITDEVEVRRLLDDAWLGSVEFCLRQAGWRFAMKEVALSTTAGPLSGFTVAYTVPTDWLRTHALFIVSGELQRPVDCRDQGRKISANVSSLRMSYVSSQYDDPELIGNPWPEHFSKAMAAYLAFQVVDGITNSSGAQVRMSQLFGQLMQEAILHDALPEDPWLRFQLDGSFQRGMRYVLAQGYWTYAMMTREFQAPTIAMPPPLTPLIGYPYSYSFPDDYLLAHAVFVPAGDGREHPIDFREDGEQWSSTAPYFAVRYVSLDLGLDPAKPPEPFMAALLSYLEEQGATAQPQQKGGPPASSAFRATLTAALATDGEPENPWYRFQRSGAFLDACFHVAEEGRWKFAVVTVALTADATRGADGVITGTPPANAAWNTNGEISPSYSAVFAKPNDWLRTIWMYRMPTGTTPGLDFGGWPDRQDIDFRDEGNNWHANYSHIQVRYMRRAAIESWRWPQSYANALLAWLEYDEARQDPQQTGLAAAKLKFYKDLMSDAASHDNSQERPPYRHIGRIIRSRYGRIGPHNEQGFTVI